MIRIKKKREKLFVLSKLFSLTGIVIIAKATGFVKQLIVAAVYGATRETDVLNLAQGLIGNLEYLFMQIITIAFVSVYINVKSENEESGQIFARQARYMFAFIGVILGGLLFTFAELLAHILAPSYSGELLNQLSFYLKLYSPVMAIYLLLAVDKASLNANDKYVSGELIGLINSIVIISCVLLFHKQYGIKVLVATFWISVILNKVNLSFCSRRIRGKFTSQALRFWKSKYVIEMVKMSAPLLVGYSLVYVNQQVDKSLASGLEEGAVTALGNAAVISGLVSTIAATLLMVHYTKITNLVAQGGKDRAAELTEMAVSVFTFVLLPIISLTMVCSDEIVSIVFERGAYGHESVKATAIALLGYAPLFLFDIIKITYEQYHYAYKESRHPMMNNSIGVATNIVLSILLTRYLGVLGITIATSIASLVAGVLNITTVRKYHKEITVSRPLKMIIGLMPAFVICTLFAMWFNKLLTNIGTLPRFLATILLSGAIYLLGTIPVLKGLITKIKEY